MKYLIILNLFLFGLSSCSDSALQKELTSVQQELEASTPSVKKLQDQIEEEGELVHVVLFKLKSAADQGFLIKEVKKLEAIDEVKDLEVGFFENLEDPRALTEYGMMMEMSFDNVADYKTYQAHPLHLALKENIKAFMAGPPATYDYVKE